MKIVMLFFMLFGAVHFGTSAYAQKLQFAFDAAGNQSQRVWVCIGCLMSEEVSADSVQVGEQVFLHWRVDPQTRELGLNWKDSRQWTFEQVRIFDRQDKLVLHRDIKGSKGHMTVPIGELPTGDYVLKAYHANKQAVLSVALTNK